MSEEMKFTKPETELKRRSIHIKNNQASVNSEEEESKSAIYKQALYPDLEKIEGDISENELSNESLESELSRIKIRYACNIYYKKGNKYVIVPQKLPKYTYSNSKGNNPSKWIYLIPLLLFMFIMASYVYFNKSSKVEEKTSDVKSLIKEIQSKFPGQEKLTYKILKVALKSVMNRSIEPSMPSVISILADKGAVEVAREFSTYLAHSLSPLKYVVVDKTVFKQNKSNKIKLEIDNEIKSKLEFNVLGTVVVHSVEDLPTEAMMIFHSYCDHETAQFKRAIYLFIFSLDDELPKIDSSKHLDEIATKHMKKIWNDKHSDFIDSLITRLTVNVVTIKKNFN